MIEIPQHLLKCGLEYFIERIPHYSKQCSRLRGTFVLNYGEPTNSVFINVNCANPRKPPHNWTMVFTNPINNHYEYKFYQVSTPIVIQARERRLYRDAINRQLQMITGDKYFKYYE